MTRQHKEFNYYCLDRLEPFENDLTIMYNNKNIIKKVNYKIGLKAKIQHRDCFILYTNSNKDFEQFAYIDADVYFDNQHRFFSTIISDTEFTEYITITNRTNIFEFVSLLNFIHIYNEFKNILENNWEILDMDNLIKI